MNFGDYPVDTQRCVLSIMSFSHTLEQMNLTWNEEQSSFPEGRDMVLNQHVLTVGFEEKINKEYTTGQK